MNKNKNLILLAAGGTGGHFFSAVAMAEELSALENIDLEIVTDKRCEKYLITTDFKSHIIDLYINVRGFRNKVKTCFLLMAAFIRAFRFLLRKKPKLVIGFGGYPSFPIMFASQILGVPTIIYEQNSLMGKTNLALASRVKFILLAYKETKYIDREDSSKQIFIGDLIRSKVKQLPQKTEFLGEEFVLLVIGGSQGAKFFSELIPQMIRIIKANNPQIKIKIIQQVAKTEQQKVIDTYESLAIEHEVADFFTDIYDKYLQAHLVVARAGASTIAELTQIGLPALYIPLPSATDDHQYWNAKALEQEGASWCYRQSEITPEFFAKKITEIYNNRQLLKSASLQLLSRKKTMMHNLSDTVFKIISPFLD